MMHDLPPKPTYLFSTNCSSYCFEYDSTYKNITIQENKCILLALLHKRRAVTEWFQLEVGTIEGNLKSPWTCTVLWMRYSSQRHSGIACVNKKSHTFICHPHSDTFNPQAKWATAAFTSHHSALKHYSQYSFHVLGWTEGWVSLGSYDNIMLNSHPL